LQIIRAERAAQIPKIFAGVVERAESGAPSGYFRGVNERPAAIRYQEVQILDPRIWVSAWLEPLDGKMPWLLLVVGAGL
jgi:hypothetical protein